MTRTEINTFIQRVILDFPINNYYRRGIESMENHIRMLEKLNALKEEENLRLKEELKDVIEQGAREGR